MVKTPPTIEDLKKAGRKLLDSGIQQLKEKGDLLPVIVLGDAADGSPDLVMGILGELNSSDAKEALAVQVKGLIAKHGFFHSVSMFDTYALIFGKSDEEKHKAKLAVALRNRGIPSPEIAKMGIGRLSEQVGVYVEAVGTTFGMTCTYERNKEGKVISFGEIEDVSGVMSGRFKFFGNEETKDLN